MSKKIVNDEEFNKSSEGIESNKRYKRLLIIGILLLLFGISDVIFNIINSSNWYSYIYSIILILFGVYFIIAPRKLKFEEVNRFNYYNKYSKKDKK